MLGRFFGVVLGLHVMAMSQMRVMAGLLVLAGFVMLGGGSMVFRGCVVVLRSFTMMFGSFLGHGILLV